MKLTDFSALRYRGDQNDVDELMREYRVGHYLDAFEEHRRRQELNFRRKLMADGILLSERLSPRVHRIFREVTHRLGMNTTAEVFCLPDPAINAFAILDVTHEATRALIGLTAGSLERLEDNELASIIGHELGHFVFEHNRLNALLNSDQKNPAQTVLPFMGESLFLRWRKKAEISADRIGMLASGSAESTMRALMKAAFGLSERNVSLDVHALLQQIDELKGEPELMQATFASHPLLPIRLKALELFSRSQLAREAGLDVHSPEITRNALEDEIDGLMVLTRRYPTKPLHVAVMRAVALGGIAVLANDGDVSDDEIKTLIRILHEHFTDEPEREIPADRRAIQSGLAEALARLNALGNDADKVFVLSRLADVALADGAILDAEGSIILKIAEVMKLPEKATYGVLIGAAQAVGFKVDFRADRIARELRVALEGKQS